MCKTGLLKTDELKETLRMIRDVFMEYEAPDYSQKGVDTFLDFIDMDSIQKSIADGSMVFWVAMDGGMVVGALAVRDGFHISMLFVDGTYHRRGIATELLKVAFRDCRSDITVNSSLYGMGFYRAVGFVDTNVQKEVDGIVYIPMAYKCGVLGG